MQEVLLKIQETKEQESIQKELDQIKKQEAENQGTEKVDPNFGKPMENSGEFRDMTAMIKIGKKRTLPEIPKNIDESLGMIKAGDSNKRQKVDEGNKPTFEEPNNKVE